MLARVAENLYWLARYLERAENVARLVGVNTNLVLDLPRGVAPSWSSLITIVGADEVFRERFDGTADEQRTMRFLVADPKYPSSIVGCFNAARENARTLRERIPREAFEQLNTLVYYARDNVNAGLSKRGRHAYLTEIIRGVQTFDGLLDNTMNHDEGYQFCDLGRHLERADMTTRILDVRSVSLIPDDLEELRPFDTIQWLSVLKTLSANQMYRLEARGPVHRQRVLEFLLQSRYFPRSVRFCAERADQALDVIGDADDVRRSVSRLLRLVQEVDLSELTRERLSAFIDELQIALADVHNATTAVFFSPPPVAARSQSQSQTA